MRVLVSIPTLGYVHKRVAAVAMQLLRETCGHEVTVIQPSHRPVENNFHHIVNQVRREAYDYWVSFDADNPPRRNPLELVDLGLDIVGCPTPVWHVSDDRPGERPIYWNVYQYVPDQDAYREHPVKVGLQQVDAIGAGCFLTSRRVWAHPDLQTGAFARIVGPDGTVVKGADLAFCERARLAGFEIHAHFGYPCSHFTELDLCEVIEAYAAVGAR